MAIVTADRFSSLRPLVLDNKCALYLQLLSAHSLALLAWRSHINDITTIGPMPMLRVLRLNRNRLVSSPTNEQVRSSCFAC